MKSLNIWKQIKIINFLYPVKIFSSQYHISLIAFLLSLLLIFKFFSFSFLGMKFSFEYIPLIFIGIYFGPVISVFFAIIFDILGWFLFFSHYPFFWMFTLQTACVAFVSGIFHLKNKPIFEVIKKNNKTPIYFLFLFIFLVLVVIQIFFITDFLIWSLFKFLISILLIGIFILVNFCILKYSDKHEIFEKVLLRYFLIIVLTSSFINSLVFGPIVIDFYIKKFGINSANIFGESNSYFSFFIFRVIKETIKIPITIFLLTKIFCVINKYCKQTTKYKKFVFNL